MCVRLVAVVTIPAVCLFTVAILIVPSTRVLLIHNVYFNISVIHTHGS